MQQSSSKSPNRQDLLQEKAAERSSRRRDEKARKDEFNQRLIDDDATGSTESRSKYKTPSSYMVNESQYRSSSSQDDYNLALLSKSTTPEKIPCPHCKEEGMTKV